MSDYHINIFYSDEDSAYVADIPDLDACSAFGPTPEMALSEVKKAKGAVARSGPRHGQARAGATLSPGDLSGSLITI